MRLNSMIIMIRTMIRTRIPMLIYIMVSYSMFPDGPKGTREPKQLVHQVEAKASTL
jgi:hypothetical protein